jgi:predicted RNA-binding Zn-ribbon protein involved in translation (DUF1610 family)
LSKEGKEVGFLSRKKKTKSVCPYCEIELEPKPTKKKKCPNCGNYIIIRTTYEDKKKKEKLLLTEEQAKKFDKKKKLFFERKNWIKRLQFYDVTDKEFDKETAKLKKRFGFNPPYADVAWSIYGKRKIEYAKKRDFHNLSNIYSEMAKLVYEENKPFQDLLEEAHKYVLLEHENIKNTMKVIVMNCNDHLVCQKCKELEGKNFTYKEATKKKILPVLDCEHIEEGKGAGKGFCRCWYGFNL